MTKKDKDIIKAWARINCLCAAIENGKFVAHRIYYTEKYNLLERAKEIQKILDEIVIKFKE